ncbi:MAG: MotA/TolQ/ExbB proton channel family protein [Spirochaetes bacterium]|nr:MotA/TolQ/ExbB proton channel family protein [Spirochaetota bacterium]
MDLASLVGIAGGFFLVAIIGIFATGGTPLDFLDIASVFITIGGTAMAGLTSIPLRRYLSIPRIFSKIIFSPTKKSNEVILTLVSFSEKARREGLLALEDDLDELDDDFLRKGLQLVVDGTDPELVKTILYADTDAMEGRHESGIKVFDDFGTFAPAFGMIGTLIGLILALKAGIEDREALVRNVAVALITTYYGALLANVFFIPTANKLRDRHNDEVLLREIMINGILAIQSGDNPRIVKDRLVSFLPPGVRQEIAEEVGEKK